MATLQDQLDLEKSCHDLGIQKYRSELNKLGEKGLGSKTQHGRALIYHSVDHFRVTIDEERSVDIKGGRPSKLVLTNMVKSDKLALITLQVLLDCVCVSHEVSLLSCAKAIGTHVLTEIRLEDWLSVDQGVAENMIRSANKKGKTSFDHKRAGLEHKINADGHTLVNWSTRETIQVGLRLTDCLIRSVGLVERIPGFKHGRKKISTKIRLTQDAQNWVTEFNKTNEDVSPLRLPLIIPPKPWVSETEGGYYSPYQKQNKLFGSSRVRQHLAEIQVELRTVNTLQRTAWSVNQPVLDVMDALWQQGGGVAGLPSREDLPLPLVTMDKPEDDAPLDRQERWNTLMKARGLIHRENSKTLGKRIGVEMMLKEASQVAQWESFWFAWSCDFRGRKYPVVGKLNPQGADHQKGLLQFSVPALIEDATDARWLAIHGANVWGNDKVSLDDRETWAYMFTEHAHMVVDDPLSYTIWQQADKPWQFLAWCYEWVGYCVAISSGEHYHTRLPCAVDGTCNGLQHLSAILLDEAGGKSVNLLPGDLPQDIYSDVAEACTEALKKQVNDLAMQWLSIEIDRKITKRPVMIVPYSGTKQACLAYIMEALDDKVGDNHPWSENLFEAVRYLTDFVWAAIEEVIVSATKVMDYIQTLAVLYCDNGKEFSWLTPTGVRVCLAYPKHSNKMIKTKIDGSLARFALHEPIPNTIDRRRVKAAASPNYTHGMDASALTLTVEEAHEGYGIEEFAMVHDSFATHSPMMPALNESIRTAFVGMYLGKDWLKDLYFQAVHDIGDGLVIPLPPEQGLLDIREVLLAEYFFS